MREPVEVLPDLVDAVAAVPVVPGLVVDVQRGAGVVLGHADEVMPDAGLAEDLVQRRPITAR